MKSIDRSLPPTKRVLIVALALAGVGAVLMLIAQAGNAGGSIGEWLGTRVGRVWLGRVATLIAIGVLLDDIAATARGRRFSTTSFRSGCRCNCCSSRH